MPQKQTQRISLTNEEGAHETYLSKSITRRSFVKRNTGVLLAFGTGYFGLTHSAFADTVFKKKNARCGDCGAIKVLPCPTGSGGFAPNGCRYRWNNTGFSCRFEGEAGAIDIPGNTAAGYSNANCTGNAPTPPPGGFYPA
jgi:hypothetical protein